MSRSLIVEADGGSRGNPGVAGFGALVRDAATGRVLAERAEPLGRVSNNVAEYEGLIAGLLAALDVEPTASVLVRMDSKLVVEQMSGRWKIKHEDMARLAEQAREIVGEFRRAGGSVRFEWIPREKNKAADKLSNDGMDGRSVDRRHADSAEDADLDEDLPPAQSTHALPRRAAPPDLAPPVRIVLVRHGVTESTMAGLLDGLGGLDAPLTAEGRNQASAAGRGLADFLGRTPVRLLTSSMSRARQTGAAIGAVLGVEPEMDPAWDEQSFGDWDGLSIAAVCAQDGGEAAYQHLRTDDDYTRPGGESRARLRERVLGAYERAYQQAVDSDCRTVVVVTHRAPMLVILTEVLGLSARGAWSLALAPASLTSLKRWADGGALVEFVNDTSHLR